MQDLIDAWDATRVSAELLVVVDEDDDTKHDYRAVLKPGPDWVNWVLTSPGRKPAMVDALNRWAVRMADSHDAIGFMGDDHRPRTKGWDFDLGASCLRGNLAYGNDLVHGEAIPTQIAMPARYVKAMGYMAPPAFRHLYVDNWWRSLGGYVGIEYMPGVVIEHMHPIVGKAEWDDTYKTANDGHLYDADRETYDRLRSDGSIEADATKCLAVR